MENGCSSDIIELITMNFKHRNNMAINKRKVSCTKYYKRLKTVVVQLCEGGVCNNFRLLKDCIHPLLLFHHEPRICL